MAIHGTSLPKLCVDAFEDFAHYATHQAAVVALDLAHQAIDDSAAQNDAARVWRQTSASVGHAWHRASDAFERVVAAVPDPGALSRPPDEQAHGRARQAKPDLAEHDALGLLRTAEKHLGQAAIESAPVTVPVAHVAAALLGMPASVLALADAAPMAAQAKSAAAKDDWKTLTRVGLGALLVGGAGGVAWYMRATAKLRSRLAVEAEAVASARTSVKELALAHRAVETAARRVDEMKFAHSAKGALRPLRTPYFDQQIEVAVAEHRAAQAELSAVKLTSLAQEEERRAALDGLSHAEREAARTTAANARLTAAIQKDTAERLRAPPRKSN